MNLFLRLLISLYTFFMKLYPRQFREEFGDEMTAVFTVAVQEASRRGMRWALIVWLRELRDYPSSLLREGRSNRQKHQAAGHSGALDFSGDGDDPGRWPPATRWETAAAILPFVLFGLLYTLDALDYAAGRRLFSLHWHLSIYPILLIGLGIGWVKGFPRWSLGYLGMALCFSYFLAETATAGFTIFGHTFARNERWDWRVWLSLLVVALVATLISRSLYPLVGLVKDIWRDWSRLSFIFFGALAWLTLGVAYDNKSFYNQVAYLPFDVFTVALLNVIGVLFYLRLRLPWQRALALQGAFSLPTLTGWAVLLLDGREEHIPSPNHILMWGLFLTILFGLMLLPGILGVIRRATQNLRPV